MGTHAEFALGNGISKTLRKLRNLNLFEYRNGMRNSLTFWERQVLLRHINLFF